MQAAIQAFNDDIEDVRVSLSSFRARAETADETQPRGQSDVIKSDWSRLKQVLSDGANLPATAVPYVLLDLKKDPKKVYEGVQGLKEFNLMLHKAKSKAFLI